VVRCQINQRAPTPRELRAEAGQYSLRFIEQDLAQGDEYDEPDHSHEEHGGEEFTINHGGAVSNSASACNAMF
jgi:hypothetical protein